MLVVSIKLATISGAGQETQSDKMGKTAGEM